MGESPNSRCAAAKASYAVEYSTVGTAKLAIRKATQRYAMVIQIAALVVPACLKPSVN